jgi:hypothetical protein
MSGQEIALIPATAADRWKYAESIADANLLPVAFRRRPADIFYAVEYGAMLGLSPIAAMTGIHVIEGKPTASSALMSALVRRHGHRLRVRVEGTVAAGDLRAVAELVRGDDPDHTFVSTWDLYRAQRAGLVELRRGEHGEVVPWSRSDKGKPLNWEKYPESMAKARAISEVCRDGAEECLFGMHYVPEELGAEVDGDGDPVTVTVEPQPETPRPAPRPAAPEPPPSVVQGEVVTDQQPPAPAANGVDSVAVAEEVAARATDCKDADELVRTFAEAKQRGLLDVDVLAVVDQGARAVVGAQDAQRLALGAWLMACGRHARDTGSSVASAAVAEPGDDDPWAVNPPTDTAQEA